MGPRYFVGLVPLAVALNIGASCAVATAPSYAIWEARPLDTTTAPTRTRLLYARQDSTMPVSSGDMNATEGEGSGAATGSVSLTVIIPIMVIAVLALAGGILWGCRYKIFKGRLALALRDAQGGQITAEELASGRRDRSASTTSGDVDRTGQGIVAGGADGRRSILHANGARPNRARRNIRRTESGRSIRTLPEYSKEAGDEELVLVRQRSASSTDGSSEGDDLAEEGGPLGDGLNRFASIGSSASRQSTRSVRSSLTRGQGGQSETVGGIPVSGRAEVTGPLSAPAAGPEGGAPQRTVSSASRRGWGEAPTYLEAMSSPSFPEATLEAGVPPPRLPSLRTRTGNSVRGLLSRAGMTFGPAAYRSSGREMQQRHSSTSLLLQPQQSRLSTFTTLTRHSRDGRDGAASPYMSPWASTLSLHISSPVPNSAVRASFDDTSFPRAGLSDDQMRFLSSQEAVNMAGVKLGDVPAAKRRRPSMGTTLGEGGSARSAETGDGDAPPPTWAEVQAHPGVPSEVVHPDEGGATDDSAQSSLGSQGARGNAPGQGHLHDDSAWTDEQAPVAPENAPAVEIEPPTPINTTFGPSTEPPLASDVTVERTGR